MQFKINLSAWWGHAHKGMVEVTTPSCGCGNSSCQKKCFGLKFWVVKIWICEIENLGKIDRFWYLESLESTFLELFFDFKSIPHGLRPWKWTSRPLGGICHKNTRPVTPYTRQVNLGFSQAHVNGNCVEAMVWLRVYLTLACSSRFFLLITFNAHKPSLLTVLYDGGT